MKPFSIDNEPPPPSSAKALLPPVGISYVSHGDFKYSGEYLRIPCKVWFEDSEFRSKVWFEYSEFRICCKPILTTKFIATLALVMAKRPELFERQEKPDPEFTSRCKSELNTLVNGPDFPDRVWSKDKHRQLIRRCVMYVTGKGASYAKLTEIPVKISVFADEFGIRFKTVGTWEYGPDFPGIVWSKEEQKQLIRKFEMYVSGKSARL